jgi:hypothetical protein
MSDRLKNSNGREGTSEESFGPFLLLMMVSLLLPHSSWTAAIQSSRRDARRNPISSADSGERSVAARWLWAAPGLSSGCFASAAAQQFTLYIGRIWKYPINQPDLVAPLCFICIGYNWEPSPPSREAEKWSNSEIGPNLYAIISGYGMDRVYFMK